MRGRSLPRVAQSTLRSYQVYALAFLPRSRDIDPQLGRARDPSLSMYATSEPAKRIQGIPLNCVIPSPTNDGRVRTQGRVRSSEYRNYKAEIWHSAGYGRYVKSGMTGDRPVFGPAEVRELVSRPFVGED